MRSSQGLRLEGRGVGAPKANGAEAPSKEVPWSQESVKPREKNCPLCGDCHQARGTGWRSVRLAENLPSLIIIDAMFCVESLPVS